MSGSLPWGSRLFEEGLSIIKREGLEKGFKKAALALYEQQLATWPQLAEAVSAMERAKIRAVSVGGRVMRLQCNPARIINVRAPIEPGEVDSRPCPICPANMPREQKALPFLEQWMVVCNPLPIFKPHFVIVSKGHIPQSADNILPAMLKFTRLTGFVSLYNGPRCGASIPGHLHFQGAPARQLPLTDQLPEMNGKNIVVDNRLPGRILLDATDNRRAEKIFRLTIRVLDPYKMDREDSEPGMNLAVSPADSGRPALVAIHPRRKHRPECFYARGEQQRIVSPGSADMAGMIILPREKDYELLDDGQVESILREVCLDEKQLEEVEEQLRR